MLNKSRFALMPLALILLLPTSLWAQQVVKMTEYGFTDDPPDIKIIAMANGDTLTTERYYFHSVPSTEGWLPFVQYCVSTSITRNGNNLFASGSCTRTDTEGDHINLVWTMADDTIEGPFRQVAGTGKYADLQCEGMWHGTDKFSGIMTDRWINETEMTCVEK